MIVDILATLLLFVAADLGEPHTPSWTDAYSDHTGLRCCKSECQPADVTMVSESRGEVWVNGELLTMPIGSIHPMPPEVPMAVSGWLCWRNKLAWPSPASIRCLWFRPGVW
jgi:hypothetical protein